jgi:hypothetical protein
MESACPCARFDGGRGRGSLAYRRCVRDSIRNALAAGALRRPCRRLLARSVCGRPERVVCCRQRLGGNERTCRVRRPARCVSGGRFVRTSEPVDNCGAADCLLLPTTTTLVATTTSTTGGVTTTSTTLPSWAAIHAAVIAPRCGSCHGIEGEAGLNGLGACNTGHANLVGVPSTQLPGRDRVRPGAPARSWLMQKLDGTQSAFDGQCVGGSCGEPMPLEPPPLDAAEREAIRSWIAAGAENDCP